MYATRPDPFEPLGPASPPGAPQPSRPSHRPPAAHTLAQRKARRRAQLTARTTEVCTKLSLNTLIILAFSSALFHLIPYHRQQQAMLREAQTTVADAQERVQALHANFTQVFDPRKTQMIMQEESYRVRPDQRQVIWVEPIESSGDLAITEDSATNRPQAETETTQEASTTSDEN
ncbi:MAG: hypothetical protein ACO4CG_12335 [Prochlorothrix sp.]|nr:hypothetical protein [Prochlorothrix sp.]